MPITPSDLADHAMHHLRHIPSSTLLSDPPIHELYCFAHAVWSWSDQLDLLPGPDRVTILRTAASVYRPLASTYLRSLSAPHPMGRPPRCGLCQMPWSSDHNCLDDDLDPEILDAANNHGQDDLPPEDSTNLHPPCAD